MRYRLSASLLFLALLSGCAGAGCTGSGCAGLPDYQQSSFGDYVQQTSEWIRANRRFVGDDAETEVRLNAPFERRPDQPGNKAVLLIHGLTDSPYSFTDIAEDLVGKGYVVRTLLLQGHGTKPEDLMMPELKDWQGLVRYHTRLLQQEYPEVWLGGYSTGANLAVTEALDNGAVNGLLLFAPAFEPENKLVALAPWLKYLLDWADQDAQENLVKYDSLAMHGAGVYYRTSQRVRNRLEERPYTGPVFIAISEADSVVDTDTVLSLFDKGFQGAKHLMWFGEQMPLSGDNITMFSMRLPEQQISNGSHMSLLYRPDNPLYGQKGLQRQCNNGQSDAAEALCRQGGKVWYSAWGYEEEGRVHARLTWNPYFDEMMVEMLDLMGQAGAKR